MTNNDRILFDQSTQLAPGRFEILRRVVDILHREARKACIQIPDQVPC